MRKEGGREDEGEARTNDSNLTHFLHPSFHAMPQAATATQGCATLEACEAVLLTTSSNGNNENEGKEQEVAADGKKKKEGDEEWKDLGKSNMRKPGGGG